MKNSNPIENGEVNQLSLYIQQENNGDHGELVKNQDRIGKESLEGHEVQFEVTFIFFHLKFALISLLIQLVKSTISAENIHVKALKDHVSTMMKADLFFEGSKMMVNDSLEYKLPRLFKFSGKSKIYLH